MKKYDKSNFQHWDLGRGLYSLSIRACERLLGLTICHIVTRAIRQHPSLTPNDGPYTFKVLTAEEIYHHTDNTALKMNRGFVDAALAKGNNCAGVFDGDQLVAYSWRSYSATPHIDGLWIDFAQGLRYGYKAYTLAKYRGLHLQQMLNEFTDHQTALGCLSQVAFINVRNFPSISHALRSGAKKSGFAGYFQGFGRTLCFRTPAAKALEVRFFVPNIGNNINP